MISGIHSIFHFVWCLQPEHDVVQTTDTSTMSSPLMDTERALGLMLGLHAACQARSTPLSQEEQEHQMWLESQVFAGGLQVLQPTDPYEEEKGESRTPSSCTTTPGSFLFISKTYTTNEN